MDDESLAAAKTGDAVKCFRSSFRVGPALEQHHGAASWLPIGSLEQMKVPDGAILREEWP